MNYDKKTIRDIDVSGKKILLRCDFNVPHDKATGVIHDDTRIVSTLPTIRYLLDHNAAVILLSHMGRPHGEWKKELSLFSARDHLEELLEMPVPLTEDVLGPDTKAKCAALQPGQVVLVENLRFRPRRGEERPRICQGAGLPGRHLCLRRLRRCPPCPRLHRGRSRTTCPPSPVCWWRRSWSSWARRLDDPKRPLVAILGGAKVSDKIGVINNLLEKADTIIIGGGMAYTFQGAQGGDIGTSLLEADQVGLRHGDDRQGQGDGREAPAAPWTTVAADRILRRCRARSWSTPRTFPHDLDGHGHRPQDHRGLHRCHRRAQALSSGTAPWACLSSPPSPTAPMPVAKALAEQRRRHHRGRRRLCRCRGEARLCRQAHSHLHRRRRFPGVPGRSGPARRRLPGWTSD